MRIKISKAIIVNFIYTFICILSLCIIAGSENLLLIDFSYLIGDIGAFVYILLREVEKIKNETKS